MTKFYTFNKQEIKQIPWDNSTKRFNWICPICRKSYISKDNDISPLIRRHINKFHKRHKIIVTKDIRIEKK